jgi:hypothetical protein
MSRGLENNKGPPLGPRQPMSVVESSVLRTFIGDGCRVRSTKSTWKTIIVLIFFKFSGRNKVMAKVPCDVDEVDLQNDRGKTVDGVMATCQR